jgi:SRSO17 transposase
VRDEIRTFALQHLGSEHVIVAIDDAGFLKRGKHSAGVGKQYYGPTGDVRLRNLRGLNEKPHLGVSV